MSAFAMGVDAIFADPNLAEDAIWRTGGTGDGVPVRIIRKTPEGITDLGGNQFDLDAMLIQVRLSEIPEPAEGDTIELQDDDGQPAETVQVIGFAKIDSRRLVRTCEVSAPLPPDEDAGP